MVRDLVEKALFYRDGDKTFFEPEAFPWVANIEAEWKVIRKELDALMLHRENIPNFQEVSKAQKSSDRRRSVEDILLLFLRQQK